GLQTAVVAAAGASIDAWAADAALPFLRAALALDVCVEPWALAAADAIVCVNLFHIAPWAAVCARVVGAARALAVGCVLYRY
ncbi:DUF938 domain-containing protein, partial [Burkholderia pseudomallei]